MSKAARLAGAALIVLVVIALGMRVWNRAGPEGTRESAVTEPDAPPCRNTPIDSIEPPDNDRKAIVFVRDCGAGAPITTQIVILDTAEALGDRESTIVIAETAQGSAPNGPGGGPLLLAGWEDPENLVVRHHPQVRWRLNQARGDDLAIRYAPLTDSVPGLVDVSGDDCTASEFVYDRRPEDRGSEPGIPFINDGCIGDRIFLGFGGQRRELRRDENVKLGTGGPYTDRHFRVEVERGRQVSRVVVSRPPDSPCAGEGESEFETTHAAEVRIWYGTSTWTVPGTLVGMECARS